MDASLKGWGAHMTVDSSDRIYMSNNLWTPQEYQLHINFLELCAIHLMLELMTNKHVCIKCDNTTSGVTNKTSGWDKVQ